MRWFVLIVSACVVALSCDRPDTQKVVESARETFNHTTDKARDAAAPVVEWTEEDLRKIGAWEYRTLDVAYAEVGDAHEDAGTGTAVEQLNELGAERWECFWVQETPDGMRFYLKRTKRSYLRYVPVGDLMRVVVPDSAN